MSKPCTDSLPALDGGHPAWRPYREILEALPAQAWSQPGLLNRILPAGVSSATGHAIRFADQAGLAPMDYEQRIAASGVVSSRARNWHDLCNALVWARLPRCKSAFNALHVAATQPPEPGRRGPLRDALTLLDESGLLLLSDDRRLLDALREHDWRQAFLALRASWSGRARVLLVGHAVLEKLLNPFKAITAKALLVHVQGPATELSWEQVDRVVSQQLLSRNWLQQPRDLSALPVMGIPGWWTRDPQDALFYADQEVFRAPGTDWSAASLLDWPAASSCAPAGAPPAASR